MCSCAGSPATIYSGCGIRSRRLALAAPAFQTPYILIANKTSDAIAVTVNPVAPSLWSFRSDDRPTV